MIYVGLDSFKVLKGEEGALEGEGVGHVRSSQVGVGTTSEENGVFRPERVVCIYYVLDRTDAKVKENICATHVNFDRPKIIDSYKNATNGKASLV